MITTVKKTFSVALVNVEILMALMGKLEFVEIQRVAGTDVNEEPILIITFEGRESKYNEDGFVEKQTSLIDFKYYYSLRVLNGHYCNDFEKFKTIHNQKQFQIQVQSIKNQQIKS